MEVINMDKIFNQIDQKEEAISYGVNKLIYKKLFGKYAVKLLGLKKYHNGSNQTELTWQIT